MPRAKFGTKCCKLSLFLERLDYSRSPCAIRLLQTSWPSGPPTFAALCFPVNWLGSVSWGLALPLSFLFHLANGLPSDRRDCLGVLTGRGS